MADIYQHKRQCPACGHKGLLRWGWPKSVYLQTSHLIMRTCRNCGYIWDETAVATLDIRLPAHLSAGQAEAGKTGPPDPERILPPDYVEKPSQAAIRGGR